jgi:hypothetical protein
MRKDEITVKLNRLLIILGSLGKFAANKMQLSTMIVNVGIIRIMFNCCLEICNCCFTITCKGLDVD